MAILNSDVQEKINTLVQKARDFNAKSNFDSALNSLVQAWDVLPNPKAEFDDSYHITKYIVLLALKFNKVSIASKWIDGIYDCDKNRQDSGEREYIHGKVEFASNNPIEAKRLFKIAFQKSEGRYPRPEDKELLRLITA